MARSVIAAICGLMPAKSAISSMHSQPMMVESMSAISRRLRRRSSATTLASTGAFAECCADGLDDRWVVQCGTRRRCRARANAAACRRDRDATAFTDASSSAPSAAVRTSV